MSIYETILAGGVLIGVILCSLVVVAIFIFYDIKRKEKQRKVAYINSLSAEQAKNYILYIENCDLEKLE